MGLVGIKRKMQYALPAFVWGFVLIFAAGAFFAFNPFSGASRSAGGDSGDVFARINGETVSYGEFEQAVRRMQDQFRSFSAMSGGSLQQQAEIPRYAYEELLRARAEARAAEAMGVSASTSAARSEAEKAVEERVQQIGAGSTKAEQAELRRILRANINLDGQRRMLLAQRLRERLTGDARPVEIKVAHVLIKTDTRTDAAARKMAEDVARRARTGEDFARLAKEKSEDLGSKEKGGVAGWASAMPADAPMDPKAKPDPNAATRFVPEFTSAALRLRPSGISDPVRSEHGWHVLKHLQERNYEPTDPKAKKDPKERQTAIDQYKSAAGSQIAEGLFSDYRRRAEVEAVSPWLQAHLAEEKANSAGPTFGKDGKLLPPAQGLEPVIAAYEAALKQGGIEAGSGLAYKLAQLYQRAEKHDNAAELLEKWSKKSGDAELFRLHGESLEKLKRKSDALAAYQSSMGRAYNNPTLLGQLADKFKGLGRKDLAQQARSKQMVQQARQEAKQKAQMEQFRTMQAQQAPKPAEKSAARPADGEVVSEVTVRTGDIDPKTGKAKIVSVTPGKPGDAKKETAPRP